MNIDPKYVLVALFVAIIRTRNQIRELNLKIEELNCKLEEIEKKNEGTR